MSRVILAMDLSLNCPGFAVLKIDDNGATLLHTSALNQKKMRTDTTQKIDKIREIVEQLVVQYMPYTFVMERGFSRYAKTTQNLFRVVGVVENTVYRATNCGCSIIESIPPKEVKKIIALDGSANKQAVAEGLTRYLGKHSYKYDDESDAAAVGIAYAILKGWVPPAQQKTA